MILLDLKIFKYVNFVSRNYSDRISTSVVILCFSYLVLYVFWQGKWGTRASGPLRHYILKKSRGLSENPKMSSITRLILSTYSGFWSEWQVFYSRVGKMVQNWVFPIYPAKLYIKASGKNIKLQPKSKFGQNIFLSQNFQILRFSLK